MNILMASSELSPLIRSGSLADTLASLTSELRTLGHEVSVVLPYYRAIRENKSIKTRKTGVKFTVPVGSGRYPCEIFETKTPAGVQVFLVSRDEYFDRSGVYGTDDRDYQDNAARFIFFTKCVLELARRADPAPQVLHLHSWETALAPALVRDQRLPFRTVLSPHGLEYQGNFWSFDFGLTNLPGDYFSAQGLEYFGSMNCLKGGIIYADAVVLPGERFVDAAQTPDYGCGLDPILREQRHKLVGIPSSDDVLGWRPEADSALTAPYSKAKPAARSKNKEAFLQVAGLTPGVSARTIVTFTNATQQAGVGSLLSSLDRLLVDDVRVALLGTVSDDLTIPLEVARRKHAGKFVHFGEFDEPLARKALAAADLFLAPAAVEPEATWLKRAILYGAAPIAVQCGGLFQYVRDWEVGSNTGNGFVFTRESSDGIVDICRRALRTLDDPAQAEMLLNRNLGTDFSAATIAAAHVNLYERLVYPSYIGRAA
ncbi:starch synthase [Terrimicrobium sacchariphilum]|uniref:starch synthase n=1 Tax=Terrimicrobium sacchariphilum TaxID=690879 RepID=A0A146G9P3_TERSA|nr:glycogen/starch synthase [Terrimicrobium sacchariphilum]GAT33993.1 starch synthase [Terrimicrobium sacchariphilum]